MNILEPSPRVHLARAIDSELLINRQAHLEVRIFFIAMMHDIYGFQSSCFNREYQSFFSRAA